MENPTPEMVADFDKTFEDFKLAHMDQMSTEEIYEAYLKIQTELTQMFVAPSRDSRLDVDSLTDSAVLESMMVRELDRMDAACEDMVDLHRYITEADDVRLNRIDTSVMLSMSCPTIQEVHVQAFAGLRMQTLHYVEKWGFEDLEYQEAYKSEFTERLSIRLSRQDAILEGAKEVLLKFLNVIKTGMRKIVKFIGTNIQAFVNICRGLKSKITKLQAKLANARDNDNKFEPHNIKKFLPRMGGLYLFFRDKPVENIRYFSGVNFQSIDNILTQLSNLDKPLGSDYVELYRTGFKDMLTVLPVIQKVADKTLTKFDSTKTPLENRGDKFSIPYRLDGKKACFAVMETSSDSKDAPDKNKESQAAQASKTAEKLTKDAKEAIGLNPLFQNIYIMEDDKKEESKTESKDAPTSGDIEKEVKKEEKDAKEKTKTDTKSVSRDLPFNLEIVKYSYEEFKAEGVKPPRVQTCLAMLKELELVEKDINKRMKESAKLVDKAYGIIDRLRIKESVSANDKEVKKRLKSFRKVMGDITFSISAQFTYGMVANLLFIAEASETYNYDGARNVSDRGEVLNNNNNQEGEKTEEKKEE